jgi:Na+/melibiose symporter-like transporter
MAIFYGPVVAALGFISVLFYFGYKLTPERHKKMLEELSERRKVSAVN